MARIPSHAHYPPNNTEGGPIERFPSTMASTSHQWSCRCHRLQHPDSTARGHEPCSRSGIHAGKKKKLDGCHEGQSPSPINWPLSSGSRAPRAPGRFLSPQTPSSVLHDAGRPNPNKSSASLLQGPPSFAETKPGKCIFRLGRSFPAQPC